MKIQITHYAASWNPLTKDPRLVVYTVDSNGSKNRYEVPVKTAEELTVLLQILKESPVFIDLETKAIYCEIEEVN